MDVNPAIIAAASALFGTLVGVFVNRRATLEALRLTRQKLDLDRESFEADTRRALTQMRNELLELVSRLVEEPHLRRLTASIEHFQAQEVWLSIAGSEMLVLRKLTDRAESDDLSWHEPPGTLTAPCLVERGAYLNTIGSDFVAVLTYLDAVLQRYADLHAATLDGDDETTSAHRDRLWRVVADIHQTANDASAMAVRDGQRAFDRLDELRGDLRQAEKTIAEVRRNRLTNLDPATSRHGDADAPNPV